MKLCQFQQTIGVEKNNCCQHRVKLIAGLSQFTKALADFLFVIYLLTLVLKTRNKSYTNTLAVISDRYNDKNYEKTNISKRDYREHC